MIQQQHLTPYPTKEVGGGKRLSQPGLGVNIKKALQMYSQGTLENKAAGYYEKAGLPIPEFDRMNLIEKYEALGEWRQKVKDGVFELEQFQLAANKRAEEARIDSLVNKKINEKKDSSSKEATT